MMRRAILALGLLLLVGCGEKDSSAETDRLSSCLAVRDMIRRIVQLEGASLKADETNHVEVLDVRGLSLAQLRARLEAFDEPQVHLWMPGEKDWVVVGHPTTNVVFLSHVLEDFAADETCKLSVPEVFASYVGTLEEILPAFGKRLEGDALAQWFVPEKVPDLPWIDVRGVDADIAERVLKEIAALQVVRRFVLEGDDWALKAKDATGEEQATDAWARAYRLNPRDPLLVERIDNLNRNAAGFLSVGKPLQALKCYETVALICPENVAALHNFGVCLMKIGKRDVAEKVLARARELEAETRRK